MAVESELQKLIVGYLKEQGVSQRKFAESTGLSETTFGTYSRMTSAMGLDALDKVLLAYPGLKKMIAAYLTGVSKENGTSEIKTAALHDPLYKDALEAILEKDNEIRRLKQQLSGAKGKGAKK